MKIVAFVMLSLMSTLTVANSQVPEDVLTSFEQMYPEVHQLDVYWETRKKAVVATFNEDGKFKKAFFASDGEWLETRVRLYPSQLPRAVFQFLERSHGNSDITFLAKVLHAGGYHYRIEAETYEQVIIELIDRHGTLLRTQYIPFTEGLELY